MERTVFFVSDGTGITAETLGQSLLTQFKGIDFQQITIPFVDSIEKAEEAVRRINEASANDVRRPIIFNTFVKTDYSQLIANSPGLVFNVFEAFLGSLEDEFEVKRTDVIGRAHGMVNTKLYDSRIEAMNFAMRHDDGMDLNVSYADVLLLGVSRSGKTPTSLYLALHYGVKAANYPLTEDDAMDSGLPKKLKKFKKKLFGLSIDSKRLQQIRAERRPDSRYSSMKQCRQETEEAEAMFKSERIPYLNTTHMSIEEIASQILITLGVKRY